MPSIQTQIIGSLSCPSPGQSLSRAPSCPAQPQGERAKGGWEWEAGPGTAVNPPGTQRGRTAVRVLAMLHGVDEGSLAIGWNGLMRAVDSDPRPCMERLCH